jgi:SAM-dependent methyltransferase
MMPLAPMTDAAIPCKCCGAPAVPYGAVDFRKNCHQQDAHLLRPSGVAIQYHRCGACGFVFTRAFDRFSHDDFARWIYNDQYALVDPEYASSRPQGNAIAVAQLLGESARSVDILDYGGGNGTLAAKLRESGFANARTFDPFVPEFSERPTAKFDLIVSFEVMEHTTDPRGTVADMLSMLREPGLVLFSTLYQPADFGQLGLNWWYAGPRNGHVSLYTEAAAAHLAGAFGYGSGSFSDLLHVFVKQVPPFAKPWLGPDGG